MGAGVLTALILVVWIGGLAAGGLADLALWWLDLPLISDRVWDNPLLGYPIVLWAFAGAVFLFGHFYLGWLKP